MPCHIIQTKEINKRIKYPYVLGTPHDIIFTPNKYARIFPILDAHQFVGNKIGTGKNGAVFNVVLPKFCQQLNIVVISKPLVIKEYTNYNNNKLSQRQYKAYICNNDDDDGNNIDLVMKFICHIDQEAEILIQSLLSDLFSTGISPHFTIHICSFRCPTSNKLFTITEKLGLENKSSMASIIFLPHILNEYYGDIFLENKTQSHEDVSKKFNFNDLTNIDVSLNENYILSNKGVQYVEYFSTIFLIEFLHTLAIMQIYYGIQSLDMRPENVLLKILHHCNSDNHNSCYHFRGQCLANINSFHYNFSSIEGQNIIGFVLPNTGFLIKFIDFGMAVAHKVPSYDINGNLNITKIIASGYYDKKFSDSSILGVDPKKFVPGYDMDVFLWLFNDMLHQWLKRPNYENIEKTNAHLPIFWLIRQLNIQRNSNKFDRPEKNCTISFSPIDALNMLYNFGVSDISECENATELCIKKTLQMFIKK